jgi:hypothetical protein
MFKQYVFKNSLFSNHEKHATPTADFSQANRRLQLFNHSLVPSLDSWPLHLPTVNFRILTVLLTCIDTMWPAGICCQNNIAITHKDHFFDVPFQPPVFFTILGCFCQWRLVMNEVRYIGGWQRWANHWLLPFNSFLL